MINMSFAAAMIISNDCADSSLEQLREVYGISLEEVSNPSIRQQLDAEQRFYMLSDDNAGYFWNNWTPIGAGKIFEQAKKEMPIKKYEDVVAKQEIEFKLRYTSFEAQMYKIIIKYLKIACNVRRVGLVGFMMNSTHDDFQFPVFHKKTVPLRDLDYAVSMIQVTQKAYAGRAHAFSFGLVIRFY